MIRILASTNIGRLATVDAEGYPYITPLNFVFHEGCRDFPGVTSDSTGYKRCWVVEIRPERMTAKSDLAQNKPQQGYRHFIAEHLVERGLPGDLEAVRAMGYELERNERGGWRIKA
jgi:hypothetical protein